ncbi:MAG: hypothetical protein R3E87_20285 [Burkholderiaceae bacterium]
MNVAQHLVGRAHIGIDDLVDHVYRPARIVQLDNRQEQAFLEDRTGVG